jgi:hypothetical protein
MEAQTNFKARVFLTFLHLLPHDRIWGQEGPKEDNFQQPRARGALIWSMNSKQLNIEE